MPQLTEHRNYIKPTGNELAKVAVLNASMDMVDADANELFARADAADRGVGEAKDAAGAAQRTADTAKATADTADRTATTAKATADTAKATADTANSAATIAKATADTAKSTAETAKATADTANSAATIAKSTADTAKATADTAKATADTANSTATIAKTTADTAKTTATTANTTANTAKTTADTANSTANTAKTTANAAMPKTGGAFTGSVSVPANGLTVGGIAPMLQGGTFIDSTVDIRTVTKSGVYLQVNTDTASGLPHDWLLYNVWCFDQDWEIIDAVPVGGVSRYQICKYNGAWRTWVRVALADEIPAATISSGRASSFLGAKNVNYITS